MSSSDSEPSPSDTTSDNNNNSYDENNEIGETTERSIVAIEGNIEDNVIERLQYLENTIARLSAENIWLKEKMNGKVNEMYDVWDRLYHCEREASNLNQYNRRENIEIAGIPNNIPNHHL